MTTTVIAKPTPGKTTTATRSATAANAPKAVKFVPRPAGERKARVTAAPNLDQMTPWLRAMHTLLSDGKWHDREELLAVGGAAVPKARAYRNQLGRLNQRGQVSTRRREDHVLAGQRFLASQALLSSVRWSGMERKDNRFRAVPAVRTAIRKAARAAA